MDPYQNNITKRNEAKAQARLRRKTFLQERNAKKHKTVHKKSSGSQNKRDSAKVISIPFTACNNF
jgi:Tfp pilus assembly protein PilE